MGNNRGITAGKQVKPPVGRRFPKGQSGNPAGRPVGSISLGTRIRHLLEGTEPLPKPIQETIRKVVGEDKKALDALIIVGLLQGLQGDKPWAQLLFEYMEGKPVASVALTDPDGAPVTFTLKINDS